MEKMSEVLDRFVEPYMKLATTEAGVRNIYSYGVAAWNASFFSVDKQKETIERILRASSDPRRGANRRAISAPGHDLSAKKAYFATNGRVILDYVLTETSDGFDLSVIALLPNSPSS